MGENTASTNRCEPLRDDRPMTFPKDLRVESPTVLAWTARQPCAEGAERELMELPKGCDRPIQAHHHPAKKMGGATHRDDMVIPLCGKHHEDAHAGVIPSSIQVRFAMVNRCRFLDEASTEEVEQYMRELTRHRNAPNWLPF